MNFMRRFSEAEVICLLAARRDRARCRMQGLKTFRTMLGSKSRVLVVCALCISHVPLPRQALPPSVVCRVRDSVSRILCVVLYVQLDTLRGLASAWSRMERPHYLTHLTGLGHLTSQVRASAVTLRL